MACNDEAGLSVLRVYVCMFNILGRMRRPVEVLLAALKSVQGSHLGVAFFGRLTSQMSQ